MTITRRTLIRNGAFAAVGSALIPIIVSCKSKDKSENVTVEEPSLNKSSSTDLWFKLSLAQWSLHRTIRAGNLLPVDFAKKASSLGFAGIEYVNQFFKDKAEDKIFLDQLNSEADSNNVKQLLIMIDGEGALADLDEAERMQSIKNHYKWVSAAKHLGCHSIRVNARGEGDAEEVRKAAVEGLGELSSYAAKHGINVIVENHGGYSSNGDWLASVMSDVNMDNCGTLPDFGNFCIKRESNKPFAESCTEEYDKYKGVEQLMPYAKAVSAKSNVFDDNGDEKNINYLKMMKIVKNHGYNGYVGVEFEGSDDDEETGIIKTRDLLIKVGKTLS